MAQMTWRVSDDLLNRVRAAATASGRSLNEFVTLVLSAATDPNTAGSQVDIIRERLLHAGVVVVDYQRHQNVASPAEVEAAATRMATGTPLAQLVSDGR